MNERLAFGVVLVLAGFFLVWFLAGNELMRRRARQLAVWCKRATDPLGGRQAVRWLTLGSFRLEVTGTRPPFESAVVTGLVESWDVPVVWLWNRARGRRDMVLAQFTLRRQPGWGIELHRSRSMLASSSRRWAREQEWEPEVLDEFELAPAGEGPRRLTLLLLDELGAERSHLVRLAVRRKEPHLTVALNVPDRSRLTPEAFADLSGRLAGATLGFFAPAGSADPGP